MLRDITIRGPLESWLRAAHGGDEDTKVLHELKMPRPSARIDIAVVNGELCGFEIKSDVDSLARLNRQKKAFSTIFDRVSIVTTDRYIKEVEHLVPAWWGLVRAAVYQKNVLLEEVRNPRSNPSVDLTSLVHLLSCRELRICLKNIGRVDIICSSRRDFMIDELLLSDDISYIKYHVRLILKSRAKQCYDKSSYCSNVLNA